MLLKKIGTLNEKKKQKEIKRLKKTFIELKISSCSVSKDVIARKFSSNALKQNEKNHSKPHPDSLKCFH